MTNRGRRHAADTVITASSPRAGSSGGRRGHGRCAGARDHAETLVITLIFILSPPPTSGARFVAHGRNGRSR